MILHICSFKNFYETHFPKAVPKGWTNFDISIGEFGNRERYKKNKWYVLDFFFETNSLDYYVKIVKV